MIKHSVRALLGAFIIAGTFLAQSHVAFAAGTGAFRLRCSSPIEGDAIDVILRGTVVSQGYVYFNDVAGSIRGGNLNVSAYLQATPTLSGVTYNDAGIWITNTQGERLAGVATHEVSITPRRGMLQLDIFSSDIFADPDDENSMYCQVTLLPIAKTN